MPTRASTPRSSSSSLARPASTRRSLSAPKKPKVPLAKRLDRHDLYQRAVQCVEAEIDFVDATFTSLRKRKAVRLREDFCGTANSSCEWVRRRQSNAAIGLDIDPEPLAWGKQYLFPQLKPGQRARIDLRRASVLDPHPDLAGVFDIVLAMNFSYWCFAERRTLVRYFQLVLESLADDGILFLDYYGGSDAHKVLTESRKIPHASKGEPAFTDFKGPFTYHWRQVNFEPISGRLECAIDFKLPDGSRMRNAFTYTWRLYTLPEIRDILLEAGFRHVTTYWEGDDGKGGGDGEFTPNTKGDACSSYIGYISAEK